MNTEFVTPENQIKGFAPGRVKIVTKDGEEMFVPYLRMVAEFKQGKHESYTFNSDDLFKYLKKYFPNLKSQREAVNLKITLINHKCKKITVYDNRPDRPEEKKYWKLIVDGKTLIDNSND